MKIAICDDDLVLNRKLHQFIFETYHDIDLRIDEYRSGEEFLQKISTSKLTYDLLLLDIEMDRVNGITVAKKLKQLSPKTFVVFITSHDEFATVGYEVSAFRYLIKPINKNKLIEAIEAAKEELLSIKSISFQNKDGEYIIPLNDILYFEAQNQEVLVSTTEQQLLHRGNLNDYEQRLSQEGFYRVHRSYLVNLRFVKSYSKIEIIELKDLRKKEIKIEDIKIIVPSLRLDNIVSDLARTSRSKAKQIIEQERVFINGQNETKLSKQIKLNDIITIRGKGRFVIKEFEGTTRSGRQVIVIEKYV